VARVPSAPGSKLRPTAWSGPLRLAAERSSVALQGRFGLDLDYVEATHAPATCFGAGRSAELAGVCAKAGVKCPLLVTEVGLAVLPIMQDALDRLDAAKLARAPFSGVQPNPDEGSLEAGIAAFKAGDHDGVIAFGRRRRPRPT